jgi:hypothetical protein
MFLPVVTLYQYYNFLPDYMSHPVAHPRFKDTNRSMSSFDDFGEIDPAMYEVGFNFFS